MSGQSADALVFAVTSVETVEKITQWIEDHPRVTVHGIYPDMGKYLIVHWKTLEEIMEIKSKIGGGWFG